MKPKTPKIGRCCCLARQQQAVGGLARATVSVAAYFGSSEVCVFGGSVFSC